MFLLCQMVHHLKNCRIQMLTLSVTIKDHEAMTQNTRNVHVQRNYMLFEIWKMIMTLSLQNRQNQSVIY